VSAADFVAGGVGVAGAAGAAGAGAGAAGAGDGAAAPTAALDDIAPVGATRVGLGYDVHAFATPEAGRPLILGGVTIAYERGLLGHSDADVLAHAVADALLGALRAGDIGEHFPDTDPAFAGTDSLMLLAQVGEMVRARGWRIVDVDTVLVAQAPRLAPYRGQMRARLAEALRLDVEQVGVKATTTERLGFEGRGEGISAQAVALLRADTSPKPSGEGCVC
jgi:2-C-methyl-D-erythritol 2,4-cyclodiphosphate synthase